MKYVRRFLHMLRYVCGSGKAIVLLAVLIKVLSGLLPAGYIAVYTKLIDGILTHLGNNQFWGMVFRLLPVFISIGFLNYFISSLTNYLTLRLQTALVKVLRKYEIKKISRLSYYHIENAETYELLNRVRKNTPNGFITGFFAYLCSNGIDFADLFYCAFCISYGTMVVRTATTVVYPNGSRVYPFRATGLCRSEGFHGGAT